MTEFFQRLRDERKKLGLNQDRFAALGGVSRDAQMNYEKGTRKPDSAYLIALSGHGIDIPYLLTGQTSAALSEDEINLIADLRALDISGKLSITSMINALKNAQSQPSPTHEEREQQRQKTLQETVGLLDDHIAKQEAGKAKRTTKKSA